MYETGASIGMRKRLGRRLAYFRTKKKITQADAAEFSHMAKSTYSLIELGERDISVTQLMRLAELYNVSINGLINEGGWSDGLAKFEAYSEALLVTISLYVKYTGKPIKKNKLMVTMCLADLVSNANYGRTITGQDYRKTSCGAVPDAFFNVMTMLDDGGYISVVADNRECYLWSTESNIAQHMSNHNRASIEKIVAESACRGMLDLAGVIKSQTLWSQCPDYDILCMDDIDYPFRQFARGVYTFEEMTKQLHTQKTNKL